MINPDLPHRRLNLLTKDWVLVSPHRAKRPWLGQVEKMPPENLPAYDPNCYLCPNNSRAGGFQNPPYEQTFVFDNDFSALLSREQISAENRQDGDDQRTGNDLLQAKPESGICRVVCFSPRHDLSLPELAQGEVEAVINTWTEQTRSLGERDDIRYVQVFENKGAMMGCSNPHPHSQIWATSIIPNEPAKEKNTQAEYMQEKGSCLLCDYLALERGLSTRVVVENEHFVGLVPYWAIWPFEMMLISRRHVAQLMDLDKNEISGLADIFRKVTARYDNLFEISFPYSMGFHQAPVDGKSHPDWHLHTHFYPPLLRSATVRKFMVGYEMLAMPQRDLTPEIAAERLRNLSDTHYRTR